MGNLQRRRALLSSDGRDFAAALEVLYRARLRADHNPTIVFNRPTAEYYLSQSEEAIGKLVQLPQPERVAIATITLLRDR